MSKDCGIVLELKECMKKKGDFPVISRKNIALLNLLALSVKKPSLEELAETILSDFGLTSKLLSLVNASYYASCHNEGKIDSLSRAILILGIEQIQSIATSLSMLSSLCEANISLELKDAVLSSFLSGFITKLTARKMGLEKMETAFLCAIFRNLGKLLVLYYLPEKGKRIAACGPATVFDESLASMEVLGISFTGLGIEMAGQWNLSNEITRRISPLKENDLSATPSQELALHVTVDFAHELCFLIKDIPGNPNLAHQLLMKYSPHITLSSRELTEIMEHSLAMIKQYAQALQVNIEEAPFLMKTGKAIIAAQGGTIYESDMVQPVFAREETFDEEITLCYEEDQPSRTLPGKGQRCMAESDPSFEPPLAEPILTEKEEPLCVVQSYDDLEAPYRTLRSLPDKEVLKPLLAELFTGFAFSRVVFCTRNLFGTYMEGRFGIGKDVETLLLPLFRFRLNKDRDIFNLCLLRNITLHVQNIGTLSRTLLAEDWLKKYAKNRSVLLIPLSINGVAKALVYADKEEGSPFVCKEEELEALKAFRIKAALAYYPAPSTAASPSEVAHKGREGERKEAYWQDRLRRAIRRGTLVPFFQPIVSNATGTVKIYECLARLVEGEEPVMPIKFIAHARAALLMPLLTMEIAKKSYHTLKESPCAFSLNLMDEDLDNDTLRSFLDFFSGLLHPTGKKAVIEIQLKAKAYNDRTLAKCLHFLKERGFLTALDNAGPAIDNLGRILKGQGTLIDYVKIDGKLIQKICTDDRYCKAVELIATMARKKGMETIALFVNGKDVHERVVDLGVDYCQGFYTGTPSARPAYIEHPLSAPAMAL